MAQAELLILENHCHLLLVEKRPDADNAFEVVLSNSVKVTLRGGELFLGLLFENLMIEAKEPQNFGSIIERKLCH